MTIDNYLIDAYHCGRAYADEQRRNATGYFGEGQRKLAQRRYAKESFLKEFGQEGLQKYFNGSHKKLMFYIEDLTAQKF